MSQDTVALIERAAARNAQLLTDLTQTQHAAPALKEQLRFIADLESEIRSSDAKLKSLDQKRRSELADHEKYRDSKINKFFHKATGQREKFSDKAAKEEREYHEVLQQQHEAQNLNDNMRYQLEQALKAKEELENVKMMHDAAQQELDNLYNSIFGGENPGFENEDRLEQAAQQALQHYHDTRVQHEEENHATHMLEQSKVRSREAVARMGDARHYSRGDMMGGGAYSDMKERDALSKAAVAVETARTFAVRAKVDNLPPVKINAGSLMSDMFFDNIFTDMAFHDEIKRGQGEVEMFAAAVSQALDHAKERQLALTGQLQLAEKELERTRNELQSERQRLFEQVLKSKQ